MKPRSAYLLDKCSLVVSLLGWKTPCMVKIFLVIVSIFFICLFCHFIIPSLNRSDAIGHVLTAWVLLLHPIKSECNLILSLRKYSILTCSFISFSIISLNSLHQGICIPSFQFVLSNIYSVILPPVGIYLASF